jgi:hypothetical protein
MGDLGKLPVFVKYAHERGNESNFNAVGNYSVVPMDFIVKPPARAHWAIERIGVFIRIAGQFDGDGYGSLASLPNGIQARVYRNDEVKVEVLDGRAAHRTADWMKVMGEPFWDVRPGNFTTNSVIFRWFFTGVPLVLDDTYQDEFRIELRDDFTGLLDHTFIFFGANV